MIPPPFAAALVADTAGILVALCIAAVVRWLAVQWRQRQAPAPVFFAPRQSDPVTPRETQIDGRRTEPRRRGQLRGANGRFTRQVSEGD